MKRTKRNTSNNSRQLWTIISILVLTILLTVVIVLLYNGADSVYNVLIFSGTSVMLLCSLALYLHNTDKDNFLNTRKMGAMCSVSLLSIAILLACDLGFGFVSIAPLALCSLCIGMSISKHGGFAFNFYVVIVYYVQSSIFLHDNIWDGGAFYVLLAGILSTIYSVFIMGRQYVRLSYVKFAFVLGLICAICRLIALYILTPLGVNIWLETLWAFVSGIVSIMLMFVIMPIVEIVFNVVSPFRFAEIATSNHQLMREMYEKAPGTYNHSLTVANYVEACAQAIGVSTFLARSVAYYHDIGKINYAKYFAENMPTDQPNVHDTLTPEASVDIIKSHVTSGLAMAKEYRMPIEVQKAIIEHHGTMPIKFFYLKAQKYTDGTLPYDNYSYDGPKPTSKISAILMICDACEATLRADQSRLAEDIVDSIVAERMTFDQFSQCDITMRELSIIKSTIITTYMGIKHDRVNYPNVVLEDR